MLRSVRTLEQCKVAAVDGEIGSVHDALIDEAHWTVRLLVIDTGTWLSGRRVVVSPVAVSDADWEARQINLRLTREQVEASPPVDAEGITREQESEHYRHYGWPYYWGGPEIWGNGVTPAELAMAAEHPGVVEAAVEERQVSEAGLERLDAPHLRSTREILDCKLEALDGPAGGVRDLLMDDGSWRIGFLVVEGDGTPDDGVLLPAADVAQARAGERTLRTRIPREEVRSGPAWDPDHPPAAPVPREDGSRRELR